MKLTLFFDHRFRRDPGGIIYSPTSFNYDLLAGRYLKVFDELRIVARVQDRGEDERKGRYVEGQGITVRSVGNWQGPGAYLPAHLRIRSVIHDELQKSEAVMLVAPGRIGQIAASHSRKKRRPYGLEVIGDPFEVFAPGASIHPLRPIIRGWATKALQRQVGGAESVAYVSQAELPIRYPAKQDAFVTHYSSIELRPEHLLTDPVWPPVSDEIRLVTIGTLEQMYKGIDVLIDALAALLTFGTPATLTVIGDGQMRSQLESRARDLGVTERVRFVGHLPAGDAVRSELDQADMFVLASRTEGLPRSMIEAMARGLPCIGTSVGGIPELLPPEDMVPIGDSLSLAQKIVEVGSNPSRMTCMVERNLDVARSYRSDVLQSRRNDHYSYLKDATLEWLTRRSN